MSESRRAKLMDLKRREELKDALIEKFKTRFGHGSVLKDADEMSVSSAVGRQSGFQHVDRFAKTAAVTEANLMRLVGPNCLFLAEMISGVSAYTGMSYLHEQDALRQQLGVKALQRKMRMDLDQQVAEKVKKKVDAHDEERRYHENSLMELERWKEQEQIRQA
ncbi:unnamed protein product [Symbiodinium pilosum]|uniref:Uncharacterized protein n=1 Tax=Symbiodinium pilosum TaxID=2952 RepID=A0A812VLB8_SYMPI|nr:unnamed protein product [Symbiodinium pilosum]